MKAVMTTTPLADKAETIRSFQAFAEGREMPAWPAELFLEISNICDLKCAMCPTFSALNPHRLFALKDAERGFLDTDTVMQPLESVLRHVLNVHCFGYGEPTINPNLADTIAYLARFEVMVDFFTNGMHLDDALAELLVKSQVHKIIVSFSGVTRDEYENVYIGGRFDQVLGGLRRLDEAKKRSGSLYPIVVINSLAFQHHIDRLDSFVELMAAHGVEYIEVKPLQEHGAVINAMAGHAVIVRPDVEGEIIERAMRRARELGLQLNIYPLEQAANAAEYAAIQAARREPATQPGKPYRFVPVAEFKEASRSVVALRPPVDTGKTSAPDIFAPDIRRALDMRPPDEGDGFTCMEPFKTLYVKQSGEVKPCCFAVGPTLGSVGSRDGESIWRGEAFSTVRDGILSGIYPMSMCGSCIKNRTGPRHHEIDGLAATYDHWHRRVFQSEGLPDVVLPDNDGILGSILENNPNLIAGNAFRGGITLYRGSPRSQAEFRREYRRDIVLTALADGIAKAAHLRVEAHLDLIDRAQARGWLWTPLMPEHRFGYSVWHHGRLLARGTANRYRSDLQKAGKGDGCYAFEQPFPEPLSAGSEVDEVEVRIDGTDLVLSHIT